MGNWRDGQTEDQKELTKKFDAGGICLDADGRHAGRDIGLFDLDLARSLAAFFRQKSVLDLGCGLGDYGRVFKEEVAHLRQAYRKGTQLHAKRLPSPAASI